MSQNDSRQTLIAINSTEWLNLCARGSIRMSKRRPVFTTIPTSDREMVKVFVSAPFTKINSSVDLFILVINNQWANESIRHRSNPSEIRTLSLADVIAHHPVAQEHFDYYNNIGYKCGVHLDAAIFEKSWLFWITQETIKSSLNAAESLQKLFNIPSFVTTKRTDRYKWESIARLVLRPNEQIKSKPAPSETLISNVQRIATAVSATRDSEQFYIACAIEWIDLRLRKDPLKKKAIKELLISALTNAKQLPFGSPSDQTTVALKHLEENYPKAFTGELTPLTISYVVLLLTDVRTKKLKPETAVRIINSLDRDSPSCTLVTFLLAASLGIELTNQLVLATSQINFVEINYELQQ